MIPVSNVLPHALISFRHLARFRLLWSLKRDPIGILNPGVADYDLIHKRHGRGI